MERWVTETKHFADSHMFRVGDIRMCERGAATQSMRTHCKLEGQQNVPKKQSADEIVQGAYNLGRRHKMSKAQVEEVIKEAGAVEAHEMMKAVSDHVKSKEE